MSSSPTAANPALLEHFQSYERQIRVRNYRMCAWLASSFMVFGASLDWVVYGMDGVRQFLGFRIATAVVIMILWWLLGMPWGARRHRVLGLAMAAPLIGSISWMIYMRGGSESPYYAGLNLVMLGAAVLMRWSLIDSLVVVGMTIFAYLLACFWHGPIQSLNLFMNNLYFLGVTGVFTTAGTWFYNEIRFSEYLLRFDLDSNRKHLEVANAQLAESNDKLRELDEAKSRFFANVSHELRTPLTLLAAPIAALLDRGDEMTPAERRAMLSTMNDNSLRLLKLINHLLDLVRLEEGNSHVNARATDLNVFIKGLGNSVDGVARSRRIQIESKVEGVSAPLMIDTEKLERICLNLIFNALKFTPAGGTVGLHAVVKDGRLSIQISDTGMGIPAEQVPHIFNRFWQADSSARRKFQGMGIGLALVKELTELMGGTVKATSAIGNGTIVTVELPAQAASIDDLKAVAGDEGADADTDWITGLYRRAEQFPAIPSLLASLQDVETGLAGGSKPRLLIADDEPDMRRFLKSQLSGTYDVLEAVDGLQAVEKTAQFLPDIILCDMMMPEKDGLQVCRELRERTSTRLIPIVLLTARADDKTKLDGLKAGASDFLPKPFSMAEVTVRLQNLVNSSSYQKDLVVQKQRLEATLDQLKETESQLVHNEKLASLGRLSAGLIHEINNPLNYARQGLLLMKRAATKLPDEDRFDYLDMCGDVEEGVNRVIQIISDLRGFTRKSSEPNQAFDLKEKVLTGMRFFAHQWKDGIQHDVDVPTGIEVIGDSNQFMQVLINLVQNAIDAVSTKAHPNGQSPTLQISGRSAGPWAYFTVRDNGCGIPTEIRSKIFDPFFTTKEVGMGLGLGLSICNRIISDLGGRIEVSSIPREFTEFTVILPSGRNSSSF